MRMYNRRPVRQLWSVQDTGKNFADQLHSSLADMAELNRDSDSEAEDDYNDEVGDSCEEEDDSDYDYTGEESNIEETERCGFDWQDEALERLSTSEGKIC